MTNNRDVPSAVPVFGGERPDSPSSVQADIVIDYINQQGGLAGRLIEPVYYNVNTANFVTQVGRTLEAEQACTLWTQTEPVFAFFTSLWFTDDTMFRCATQHGTIAIDPFFMGAPFSQAMLDSFGPYVYATERMSSERRDRAYVETLARLDFLDPRGKYALLVEDTPAVRSGVDNVLIPALEARGITLDVIQHYPDPFASPWPAYAARFKAAGIDHVLFSDGALPVYSSLLMLTSSLAVRFTPRFALTTAMEPDFHRQSATNLHPPVYLFCQEWPALAPVLCPGGEPLSLPLTSILHGAVGMGWIDRYDTGDKPNSLNDSAAAGTCSMAAEAAQARPDNYMGYICDGLFFMQAALSRAVELSADGFADGAESLGSSYESPVAPSQFFGPGRHDGLQQVRGMVYDDERARFRYVTPFFDVDCVSPRPPGNGRRQGPPPGPKRRCADRTARS